MIPARRAEGSASRDTRASCRNAVHGVDHLLAIQRRRCTASDGRAEALVESCRGTGRIRRFASAGSSSPAITSDRLFDVQTRLKNSVTSSTLRRSNPRGSR